MSDKKMSPELQIAIRRSPGYTAPSAELVAMRTENQRLKQDATRCQLDLSLAESEIAELRLRLSAADAVALAAMERAKKLQAEVDRMQPEFDAIIAVNEELRAEVAGWRRAVRWEHVGKGHYSLRIVPTECAIPCGLGDAVEYVDGWRFWCFGGSGQGLSPDRHTACAKVCELLGIPAVLPVGGE